MVMHASSYAIFFWDFELNRKENTEKLHDFGIQFHSYDLARAETRNAIQRLWRLVKPTCT